MNLLKPRRQQHRFVMPNYKNVKTMKRKKIFYLFIIIILFYGCHKKKDDFKYDVIVTDSPSNLNNLNSIYDDYNSDLPYISGGCDLYFSSNRNSSGDNFDIIGKSLGISYHQDKDILNIDTYNTGDPNYANKCMYSGQSAPFNFII